MSADKRERVLRAAETLGFRPNSFARALVNKTVNLVAILVNQCLVGGSEGGKVLGGRRHPVQIADQVISARAKK